MREIKDELLKDVAGGYYGHRSLTPPTICPKCGKQLTKHPRYGNINGFPLFVCSSNVWDEGHWVLWYRREPPKH